MRTIPRFSRAHFLGLESRSPGCPEAFGDHGHFDWGGHITCIGPTGSGKTHLIWDVLEANASPEHPTHVFVKKPKDGLITQRSKELGFKTHDGWPPPRTFWGKKPPGYVFWPKTSYDPEKDHPAKAAAFNRAFLDLYRRGKSAIWADDAFGLAEILGLKKTMVELWTELRSMDGELIATFQKPSHVPTWAYSMASHLFLFNDPDRRNRLRFAEIGGVDGQDIARAVAGLKRHEVLYINRDGPAVCIVERD